MFCGCGHLLSAGDDNPPWTTVTDPCYEYAKVVDTSRI